MTTTSFWAPMGWVGRTPTAGVAIDVADGLISGVRPVADAPADATVFDGAVVPGMVNTHSHVFHRALRAHSDAAGDFWVWRKEMFRLAERLDPESFERLAAATFAEMLAAGVTMVGEFHYLHHGPEGIPYEDPNEMSMALVRAAETTGIRLCLLDTCYLMAGADGAPLEGPQRRFGDGVVERWAIRHRDLTDRLANSVVTVGSAIHSVRAVPPAAFETISGTPGPTHVHASEQPAENEACRSLYGVSPIALLARHGGLGPATTLVHAVHADEEDLRTVTDSGSSICVCPTTELDLGDGTADVAGMSAHGIEVSLGSDSHVAIDLLAEARLVEWNDRARYGRRGVHSIASLWDMASRAGAHALGNAVWGLEAGAPADFAVIGLDHASTAGIEEAGAIIAAATASDVVATFVSGEEVTRNGEHRSLGSIGERLASVVREFAG